MLVCAVRGGDSALLLNLAIPRFSAAVNTGASLVTRDSRLQPVGAACFRVGNGRARRAGGR
jgi:hypothetical protein